MKWREGVLADMREERGAQVFVGRPE